MQNFSLETIQMYNSGEIDWSGVKIHDKETMDIERKIKGGHTYQIRSIWELAIF